MKYKLGDICQSISEISDLENSEFVYPINTADVFQGKIVDNIKSIEIKQLKGQFKKTFKKNDILYSEIRPINQHHALIDFDKTESFLASTKLMVIRANEDMVLSKYLYIFLTSLPVINQLQKEAETRSGTFPQITFGANIAPLEIELPSIQHQVKVIEFLTSIDKKIEINKKINKNLEDLIFAIFDELFSNQEQQFKKGIISDLGEVIGGSTPSKLREDFYYPPEIPWITPKDLSTTKNKFVSKGETNISKQGFENSSTKVLPKNSILFSSRAPIGYIAISNNSVTTNQGFKSIIPKKDIPFEFLYCLLKKKKDFIENQAVGSTFKEISQSQMKDISIYIPDKKDLLYFHQLVSFMFEIQRKNEEEISHLQALKKILLPKLLSGEIEL